MAVHVEFVNGKGAHGHDVFGCFEIPLLIILSPWIRTHWVTSSIEEYNPIYIYIKVKWSLYRPRVAQRVGRGIAVLFHDRGIRRQWVVSSSPRPHFTPGKDPVPILQEVGWAPGPVWMGGKSRPHRDSIPDCPACSQSLYRLSYSDHTHTNTHTQSHTHTHIYIQWYLG
jgi:hypothetical protein